MSNKNFIRPPFDFDRNTESALKPINYITARRLHDPIYCALIKELYQEGCSASAAYLHKITTIETELYKTKAIRDRICDDNDFLMAFYENMKTAEIGFNQNTVCGYQTTCKCLYQILKLFEPVRVKYDYLLQPLFDAIAPMCEHIEQINSVGSEEVIARIYFRSGSFLSAKDQDLVRSIKYMEKALKLSRNEGWVSDIVCEEDWGLYPIMHLLAGRRLSSLLLRYGRIVGKTNPNHASELAHKAIIALSEADLEKNKILYFNASMERANFLIRSEHYESARRILRKLCEDLATKINISNPSITSKLYMHEGICLLNLKNREAALKKFQEALEISTKNGLRRIEGKVCLAMGTAFLASSELIDQHYAGVSLKRAKKIFTELGDLLNRKKTEYMLAKLKAEKVFPHLMDLLKDGYENFCYFYNLRQWKNHCKPFWQTLYSDNVLQSKDFIYCLMEDTENLKI